MSLSAVAVLPAVVARYLARALGDRAVPIASAAFRQDGELRTGVNAVRWLPFTATQTVGAATCAFAWDARVRVAPGVHLRIRDAYASGRGSGRVDLWGIVPLAREHGGDDLNRGALLRFLAEAPWYPSVLRPSAALTWSATGEDRARATLVDRDSTATLEFRFDADGDVASVHADARPCRMRGGYRPLAWEGRFFDWRDREGLRVPDRGEVGWYVEGAWICVWRGRITAAVYRFADRA